MNPLWLTLPVIVPVSGLAFLTLGKAAYSFARTIERDKIIFARERVKSRAMAIQQLRPDEHGRLGWTFDADTGVYRNLDTLEVIRQAVDVRVDPLARRLLHLERLMLAAPQRETGELMEPLVPPAFQWPDAYSFSQMARRYLKRPSWHNVLLGVSYDDAGNESPIISDMEDMIHVMIGGRSGFGKSNLEYAIARQLIDSADPCKLALVDYAGTTLTPLAQHSRVLFPVATNDAEALAVFGELVKELERRKQLYADCPGVQKLSQYNALDDRKPLEPWFVFIDETPQLARNARLCQQFTIIAEQARKFGLGIVAAGTTWHARVVPEWIRVNFATRAAVYCSGPTSRVVLEQDSSASELERPGQACVMLPGKTGVQRILTPEIEFEVVDGDGPVYAMPEERAEPAMADITEAAVLDAWDHLPDSDKRPHKQKSALCRALGVEPVGAWFTKVDGIARRLDLWVSNT